MSVVSKVRGFFSRHRNKFLIGGALITGSIFLTKYASIRLRDYHQKEAIEYIERTRKQNYFESINQTCNQTILNLSNALLDKIYLTINTDAIIEELKSNPDNKIELWNTLKVQVFTKAGCIIYMLVMFVITIKVQLNILGGYQYKDADSFSEDMQKRYLSLCQDFLNTGVDKISSIVEKLVKDILTNVDLKKPMKLRDIETIFWSLQAKLETGQDNPITNLRTYIFPEDPPNTDDIYSAMLRDTADLLESDEVRFLVVQNVNSGFGLLGDELSEFFNQNVPKIIEVSNGEFQNPYMTRKPLAKLVPILNGLLTKQSFPYSFRQYLLTNEKLQVLCANVYESLLP